MSTVRAQIDWKPMTRQWLKFNAVGIIGTLVQLSILTLLVALLGKKYYLLWTMIAVETAILHNFVWHVKWTWTRRMSSQIVGSRRIRQIVSTLVRFNLSAGAVSIIGNLMLMRAFVGGMGLNFIVANLASIVTCSLINFILSDRFVFVPKS
jgi:putative flippase GtrA